MPKLAATKTDTVYRNAKPKDKPYLIADGGGLYLMVTPEGGKHWIFRYRFDGCQRKIALSHNAYPGMSVRTAREQAQSYQDMLSRGEDPVTARKTAKATLKQEDLHAKEEAERKANTFEKVAREWFAMAEKRLSTVTSISTIRRLEQNIFPWLGAKPITDIRAPDILAALRRIESRGALESAHRILGICSQVFRFAVYSGIIDSDPCRDLRGALAPVQSRHLAALTKPEEVAGFLRAIESYTGATVTRIALKLSVLTFVRAGNLRMAEWAEFFDLDNPDKALWRIASEKMKVKGRPDFVVPLARQAVVLLEQLRPLTGRSRYVFPSARTLERPMSNMAVLAAIRRMGYTKEEMTGHGVRAMAKTLGLEVLGTQEAVIEECLAHAKKEIYRGAYDRTTYMSARRLYMQRWADYLDQLLAEPVDEDE